MTATLLVKFQYFQEGATLAWDGKHWVGYPDNISAYTMEILVREGMAVKKEIKRIN